MEIRNSGTNANEWSPVDIDRANASSMDALTSPRLTEKDIVGLKYFDQLLPLFERLHDDGCGRDKAGNRILHYDQYCLMSAPPMHAFAGKQRGLGKIFQRIDRFSKLQQIFGVLC